MNKRLKLILDELHSEGKITYVDGLKMPVGGDQGIRLKHMLEENVEDKYYLSDEIQKRFKTNGKIDVDHNELNQLGSTSEDRSIGQRDRTYGVSGICPNLTATDYKQPKQIVDNKTNCIGQVPQNEKSQAGKVYAVEGTSQTLCAGTHGYAMGNIAEPQIVASRGRYNSEGKVEQNYEVNDTGNTNTITTVQKDNYVLEPKVDRLGGCFDKDGKTHQAGSVYNKEGLSPTITTCEGGYRQPIVTENNIEVVGKLDCKGWHDIETRVNSTDGIGATVECRNRAKYLDSQFCENNSYQNEENIDEDKPQGYNNSTNYDIISQNCDFRIRKLTPLECFRLQGFDDEDFYKAKDMGLSDSALYKLAGNSIVVNCLYYIFKNVFKEFEIK